MIEEATDVTASRSSRLMGVLFAGVAAFAVVSACSAGQITQTATQVAAVPGASVNGGPNNEIALRDLFVAYNGVEGYPQGGSAPLVVRVFNDGQDSIKLVGVSAAGSASGVALVGGAPSAVTPTPGSAAPQPSATAAPTATPGATPPASPGAQATPAPATPSPAPPRTTAPAGQTSFRIEIPAGSYLLLVPGQGPYLQLTGLTTALTPGESVPLTFTFEGIDPIEITVPFGIPVTPAPRNSPDFEPGHE